MIAPQDGVMVVLLVAVALLLGSALRNLTRGSRVPYSAALLVAGLLIGALDRSLVLSGTLPQLHLSLIHI